MISLRMLPARTLLSALLLAAASPLALAYPFESILERATVIGPVSREAIIAADFDGDGIDEVVVATASPTPTIIAYSNASAPLKQRQVIRVPWFQTASTRLQVWASPQGPRLVSVTVPGSGTEMVVSVYAGWPLVETTRHTLPPGLNSFRVGDVDVDGSPELIGLYSWDVRATSLDSGELLWSLPVSGIALALDNLDADPALEIVISGIEGYVYDGATRAREWSYMDGFGGQVATGRVGPNGAIGFIGARHSGYFTVFSTAPWSPIWDQLQYRTHSLHIANLDGLGADEIITSEENRQSVRIFDSQTRMLRRDIQTSMRGSSAIAAPRIHHGTRRHIVQAASDLYGFGDALALLDPETGSTVVSLDSDTSGAVATAIGDFNADGRAELLMSSGYKWGSRIRIADIDTGEDMWLSPLSGNVSEPLNLRPRRFLWAQLDADAAQEIVIAGDAAYDGRIVVMDGASKAIQLQIGDNSTSSPLASRFITDALLMDFDNDGHLDIVVSTEPANSGESGVRLHAFSLQTGTLLWESVRVGAGFTASRGVFQLNDGNRRYLVAVLNSGLRAFGVESQLLEWTYSASIGHALLLENAPGGAEIVLTEGAGRVTHLDAATLEPCRTYVLPEDIRALVALPAAPYLLAAFHDSLALLGLDGRVVGEADGVRINAGSAPLAVVPDGASHQVLIGTSHGFRLLALNPDGIFKNGFDPD